jgi:hypothetical protein
MPSFFPPSLPPEVLSRSFKALNGEIGVHPMDATLFVEACKKDACEVLGWELWLADHSWDDVESRPRKVPIPGYWCGLIPEQESGIGGVYGGDGDADHCLIQIGSLDFQSRDLAPWRGYIRVNFTLG